MLRQTPAPIGVAARDRCPAGASRQPRSRPGRPSSSNRWGTTPGAVPAHESSRPAVPSFDPLVRVNAPELLLADEALYVAAAVQDNDDMAPRPGAVPNVGDDAGLQPGHGLGPVVGPVHKGDRRRGVLDPRHDQGGAPP